MVAVDPKQPGSNHAAPASTLERCLAACGIVGVVGFVAAWAIAGQIRDGYSGVDQAISQLAAVDSPGRGGMTAGFVAFGLGVPLFGQALRRALHGPAWIAATITGIATLGVAATPLGRYDVAHNVFAVIGYVSLAATPLLAAKALHDRGTPRAARWSAACGIATAVLLTASAFDTGHGLTQRLGLGITDAWIVAAALCIIVRPSWSRGTDSVGATP